MVALQEFKSGSATRVGAAGKATPPDVADPKNSTHYQAFQDSGSLGSAGSDRGVYFESQIKLSPAATVVNSGVAPLPVADPSDPSDPKPETLEVAYQDLDQSIVRAKKLVADPSVVADPNSSASQPDPTRAATESLKVGDRVEIVLAGSRYQGQTGEVRRVYQDQGLTVYTVQLEGGKRIDYQRSDLKLAT